jgi:hypothetical protein
MPREAPPELPPISQGTVCKIEAQFRELGHVKPLKRQPTFDPDDTKINVLFSIAENPTPTLRQVALENGISNTTVLKCFKKEKLQYVQQLTEDDPDRGLQFCDQMMGLLDRNERSLDNIMLSDESTFTINGKVNRQNCRYWAAANPHWMRENHSQYPEKVNVWAGILNDRILGPIFIDGNLTGEKYLNLLRDELVPVLAALFISRCSRSRYSSEHIMDSTK